MDCCRRRNAVIYYFSGFTLIITIAQIVYFILNRYIIQVETFHVYTLILILLNTFSVLFFCSRSQKVIDYFSSKPLGDKYANYYPPMKQYNSLLRKLRFLGIYRDEHMVSQKVFLVVNIYRCTNLNSREVSNMFKKDIYLGNTS